MYRSTLICMCFFFGLKKIDNVLSACPIQLRKIVKKLIIALSINSYNMLGCERSCVDPLAFLCKSSTMNSVCLPHTESK